MYIVNAEQMRALDRYTIDHIGIPALVLMENAGRAAAEEIIASFGGTGLPPNIAVLVGKGNNGADGIVAARHLLEADVRVELIYADDPALLRNEAEVQKNIAQKLDIPYRQYTPERPVNWSGFDGIVDALLGTGTRGAPRGSYADLIREANGSGLPIYSIDIPSGLDADTGEAYDPCIRAKLTVALAFSKRGLEQEPGATLAGRVVVRFIGIPERLAGKFGVKTYRSEPKLLMEKAGLREYRDRTSNSHKGTYGHALIAAGSRPMGGAGLLCSKAALRAGCGLLTWALPDRLLEPMLGLLPEAMLRGLADGGHGDWREVRSDALIELAREKDAMALGPGLGRWDGDSRWLRAVWEGTECPLVLDADALNMIAEASDFNAWTRRKAPVVLTPHPGEMARLCGKDTRDVQRDRIETARRFAEEHGVVLVLKGARTVIATPDGEVYVNPTGNPGMATGGTGDVLAGITAGLLAQGLKAYQAAVLGVYLHGESGDRAAGERTYTASLTAGDIVEKL